MTGVAMLPKFEEQMFRTVEPDAGRTLYLIPTAEVALTALHGGEILPEADAAATLCAFTPCYRREAGTYGEDTKGMIRQHQFDKVEMVKIATPGQSYDELEAMVRSAEVVLQRLELPYRVVELLHRRHGLPLRQELRPRGVAARAGQVPRDLLLLELRGLPGAPARHRASGPRAAAASSWCHTLNGSGLAVGRTLIAVLENYQEADGSVIVPAVLRPYMGGLERIGPVGAAR